MSEINLIAFPPEGEQTQVAFCKQMASELSGAQRDVLREISRALTERGWIPPLDQLVAKLAEDRGVDAASAALDELAQRRLVDLDRANNQVVGALGCLSATITGHRALLPNAIELYTWGGFDLLTLHHTLGQDVEVFTTCGHSGKAIQLKIVGDQIVESNINGIAGYLATWDGQRPLADVARDSPLFASDEDLETWEAAHPDIEGMALPADLLLWVGMSGARELGAARASLISG